MEAQENVVPIEGTGRVIARQDGRLGGILAEEGKLSAGDIERVLELQRVAGLRFGEAALRLGLIAADDLRCAVAKQYGFPYLPSGDGGISSELVVAYEPFHPRAEELRALRTQLLIRWSNAGIRRRMLAIVSPGSGEGRSYVAANLAVVFSQLGERTLLIDADLRAPRQHRIFNVPDRIGLSAVLSGRADRGAVVPIPEVAPGVRDFAGGVTGRVRRHPLRYAAGEVLRRCAESGFPGGQRDGARPQRPHPFC